MKILGIVGLFFWSGLSWAVEYRIPVENRSLKPFAKFQLEAGLSISDETLNYSIPKAMTGEIQDFEMQKIGGSDNQRFFEGDSATAICEGDEEKPVCEVTFKPNSFKVVNREARDVALQKIYKNPKSFQKSKKIVDVFSSEEQPIGILDYTKDNDLDITDNKWNSKYRVGERWIRATLCFKENFGSISGHYRYSEQNRCHDAECGSCPRGCSCGKVSDIEVHGKFVSAYWKVGNSEGWIEWEFENSNPMKFNGSYSFFKSGPKAGIWKGEEAN